MVVSLLVFSVVLLVLSASLSVIVLRQRARLRSLKRNLDREIDAMNEPLARISYGLLNQSMRPAEVGDPFSREFLGRLDLIRDSFNSITSAPISRLCYVGTDAWMEGAQCARHIGQRLERGGAIAVLVTSSLSSLIMAQRQRSFITTMAREFPLVRVAETFEANADQERARAFVRERSSGLDALYVTGNSAVPGVIRGLDDSGRAGKVYVLCHDLDAAIVGGLRSGRVQASIVCSTYAQGRDPVLHVFNHLVSSWAPRQPRLILKLDTATRANLEDFWDEGAQEPRRDSTLSRTGVAACGKSGQPLRILAFCEDWNNAFLQMLSGVNMAANELRSRNSEVVVHVLNQMRRPIGEVIAEAGAVIMRERARGLHGIVSYVGKAEMAPLLNAAAAEGIAIATYNSEPLQLRSMIAWLLQSANRLGKFTDEYRAGHHEIDRSLQDSLPKIRMMADRVGEEADSVREGAATIATLSDLVERTEHEEREQNRSLDSTYAIAGELARLVGFFEQRVQGLRDMGVQVRRSAEKTEALQVFSEKIQSITGIIDGIAEQTNLLAFNAAVEASHAGEWGKGFKVISQEIRALADQSVASTRDITQLIDSMREAISAGVAANGKTQAIVDEQVQAISAASTQMAELAARLELTMGTVRKAVERNTAAIEQMKGFSREINQVMSRQAEVSADNSSTMQSISGSFAGISARSAELQAQTVELAELVTILANLVSSFTTD